MSQKSLLVGLVGCGGIAQQCHLPALRQTKGMEIAALCDVKEELARGIAGKLNVKRYYADLAEMLQREKLSLVDICTPPGTHATLAIQAMEAGCHVLVEKPMAISCQEADEMIRAAEKNRVKLCVAHNQLFLPVVTRAISMVRKGFIGDLTGVNLGDAQRRDNHEFVDQDHWIHRLPGGLFGEHLPHPIYLAMALLGHVEPATVYATKLSNYDWVVADEARVVLQGEKGIATITASHNWPKVTATLDIFGTRRNLHVDRHSSVLTSYGIGGESRLWRALENVSQSYQQLACTASAAVNTVLGRRASGHGILIGKFVQAIRGDGQVPVTAGEGREVVRVLEKITSQIESVARRRT